MASPAVIGALRVVLGADSAALEKGLSDASARLNNFGATVAKAGAVAATAFVAAGAGIGVALKGVIDQADKIGKASEKIGIPSEQLSALKYAADLADVSFESLNKGLQRLSRSMVDAAAKPTSEASNAFRALGVSVTNTDGSLKTNQAVLNEVATRFEGLRDGAGKTAAAIAIFGRAGADLIPMLNAGKTGLAAMAEEAAQLGIIIDTKTQKSAQEFNDNLRRLSLVKEGITVQIAARLLPALESLSRVMVDGAKNARFLDDTAKALTVTMQSLVSGAVVLGAAFKVMAGNFSVVAEAFRALSSGDFSGALEALKRHGESIVSTWSGVGDTLTKIWVPAQASYKRWHQDVIEGGKKGLGELNFATTGAKNALEQFIVSQQRGIAAKTAEIATDGLAAGAKERMRFELQALAIAQQNGIVVGEAYRLKIEETGAAIEQMNLKIEGQKLLEQVTPIWERYTTELNNNRAALEALGATSAQVAASGEKTAEKFGLTWTQQTASVAGSLSEMANTFGQEHGRMAAAAKALSAVQALVSAYAGAAQALTLPFPANIAAYATVLAKGLTAVMAIRSAVVPKMQTGGLIGVPGGLGGGDKVPVQMLAEPGEEIEVHPNRPGARGSQEITVHGIRPRDLFTGEMIRDLFEGINSGLRDGHKIVLAPA